MQANSTLVVEDSGATGLRARHSQRSAAIADREHEDRSLDRRLSVACDSAKSSEFGSSCWPLPLPFRLLQPLGHLLVLCGVERPALCRPVPTVILDGHVDAAVDEELHGFVIFVPHQLMQDAGGLMRAPVR